MIRKIRVEDIDEVVELFDALGKEHLTLYPNRHMYKLDRNANENWKSYVLNDIFLSKEKEIFVCELNDVLCGYVTIEIRKRPPIFTIKEEAYISDLYVLDRYRGEGIGKKLVEKAIQWAKNKKVKNVSLEVEEKNKSVDFYKKINFRDHMKQMVLKV
ncbi:GNAT family N-acetyltransferase [Candidatus Micrarchaeota archaeon]|nr:GNAT family N-acetyltransferase [Candidatus Micrarchaeota archaeon]